MSLLCVLIVYIVGITHVLQSYNMSCTCMREGEIRDEMLSYSGALVIDNNNNKKNNSDVFNEKLPPK